MRVDVHQHLWTEPLIAALHKRDELPYVRREHGDSVLHMRGEPPYVLDAAACSPELRSEHLARDGLDAALVALSSPVGIERLARAEAQPLIDAHLEGMRELPRGFGAWAPVALDGLDAAAIDRTLDGGDWVGISIPAGALSGIGELHALAPALERVAARGVPLFVHPGPGRATEVPPAQGGEPPWWRAVTTYVAEMYAAWLALCALSRFEHPTLTVVFAMLAGGAPLLSERLEARGGPPVELGDERVFYDTSSYGPAAIDAMAGRVGSRQLLYGSDRPVVAPRPTAHDERSMENGGWLVRAWGETA